MSSHNGHSGKVPKRGNREFWRRKKPTLKDIVTNEKAKRRAAEIVARLAYEVSMEKLESVVDGHHVCGYLRGINFSNGDVYGSCPLKGDSRCGYRLADFNNPDDMIRCPAYENTLGAPGEVIQVYDIEDEKKPEITAKEENRAAAGL